MLEFALALPLLLTLLYGLLETGRLTFIYASTVTAARQAVRYGSATGTGPNGVPYYQDCAGIEAAAQSVGFINDFQNIKITYDKGPQDTDPKPICPNYGPAVNGHRIRVSVEAQWQPIVPIVPLEPFTIHSESARTLLASVSIQVTSAAIGWVGSGSGELNISVVPSTLTYQTVGQVITYTYTLVNNGGASLSAPYVITDNKVTGITCNNPPATLISLASFQCTGTYVITQADLDAGSVTNTATATAGGVQSVDPPATATITATPLPKLTLSIEPSPEAASKVGTTITYTYTLTNSGNVTLNSPYTVTDSIVTNITCPGAPNSILPNQSVVCVGSRQLTATDITNGSVSNQATASAKHGSTDVTSNSASATVVTTALYVKITPSIPAATAKDQVITYTYYIINTTDATANNLNVSSSKTSPISCSNASIPAGGQVTCTGTYTVTLTDMNTGGYIQNIATASANNGTQIDSNTAVNSLPITQTPALSAVISATPNQPASPSESLPAGTVIAYTYTLTNSGNVTLTSPFTITDDLLSVTCADQSNLDPGASRTCTTNYTLTSSDIDAGSVINTGTASAKFGTFAVNSAQATYTVVTFSGARFSLDLVASPTVITQSNTAIVFTYTITNTGGKPLSAPYTITSSIPSIGTFLCGGVSAPSLAPGASMFCQNTFTTSNTVTNTITAATAKEAKDGGATVSSSNLPSVTITSALCTTGTLTLSPPAIENSSPVVTWTITNDVGSRLTIKVISISWSTQSNTYLSSVELPSGTTVWSGSDKDGSEIISGTWTIDEGITTLKMTFTKNKPTITDMTLTFDEVGCGPLSNP